MATSIIDREEFISTWPCIICKVEKTPSQCMKDYRARQMKKVVKINTGSRKLRV